MSVSKNNLDQAIAPAQQPAQPRVERYGDGVLVHWPEGMEQYVPVGDCVTGNIAPPAAAVPEVLCTRCGHPTMHMGSMCYGCTQAAMLAANKENTNG